MEQFSEECLASAASGASELSTHSSLEFDAEALEALLKEKLADLEGPISLERIGGGQPNPTFFVSFENRRLVLRKRPANAWPSAIP